MHRKLVGRKKLPLSTVGRNPEKFENHWSMPRSTKELHYILLSPIYRKLCRTSRNPSSKYRKWEAMYLDGHIFALKTWLTMQPVLEHPDFKFQIFIDADADGDGLDVTRYFRERNVHQP
ncbi:hypothetical protein T4E_3209 [Trichinella pseudospiralis]|uniref:Uncharacterized protein n=1 Tax=Trichinella pseudospiralis TaxID=6337 RepID=A0A0V0Y5C3_TRIPS|nr:hypothetical protein T4E_3209 [Trichinella pseudospiralis]KRY91321.1 hypothetical protein T4D_4659 [Trichinella pseudospiralis]